jgi:hypothetical protein
VVKLALRGKMSGRTGERHYERESDRERDSESDRQSEWLVEQERGKKADFSFFPNRKIPEEW